MTRSVCVKNVTQPVLPAETVSFWVIAAVVLSASVCVTCLLFGCFALLWCIYKKTKYAFSTGHALPQHLKEVGGGGGEPGVDK